MNVSQLNSKGANQECEESIKSEIGSITRCSCCDSYNIYLGNITLHMNQHQVHSLFYMLLKTMRLENKSQ